MSETNKNINQYHREVIDTIHIGDTIGQSNFANEREEEPIILKILMEYVIQSQ